MVYSGYLVLSFIAGLLLGFLFFGGLWLTVKKAIYSKNPALWFAFSSLLRIIIVLAGFYFIAWGSWQRLLISLFGFIVSRFLVIGITKSIDARNISLKNNVMP